nr:MAG TPA: tRNA modification GTPase mnmE [Caudoviricetes sp.]
MSRGLFCCFNFHRVYTLCLDRIFGEFCLGS